jgi:hypothetical protein
MFTKNRTMKTSFKDLNIKEKLAICSALAAFIIGWGMSIAGFIVPPLGEVHESILFILGQALVYAASVFGIAAYFKAESHQMKSDLRQYFSEKERLQEERFKLRNNVDDGEIPNE